MADLTYSVEINTTSGINNLQKLQDKISGLSKSFGNLQTAVIGLFAGATIKSALAYADAITDISTATNIAVENVLGFSDAVAQNGGSIDGAQKALVKLTTTIGEAADGSDSAQNAFRRVGVTLTDLRTLSEKDLLAKTVKGLSQITDTSQRAAAQTAIFGKSMKGVDLVGLQQSYAGATVESVKYAQSVEQAGRVADKLTAAFTRFKLELLKAFEPLANMLEQLKPEQIQAFIDALIKIGSVAGGLAAVAKGLEWINAAITALSGLWVAGTGRMAAGIAAMEAGFASIGKTIGIAIDYVARFFRATPQFAESNGFIKNMITLLEKLAIRFGFLEAAAVGTGAGILAFATGFGEVALAIAGVASATWLVGEAIDAIFGTKIVSGFLDGVTAIWNKMKDIAGLKKDGDAAKAGANEAFRRSEIADYDKINKYLADQVKINREVKAATDAKILSIQQASKAFADQNKQTLLNIGFENQLIGKTQEESQVWRAQKQVFDEAGQAIKKLTDEKLAARAALKPGESDLSAVYDQQIAKIKEQAEVDASRIGEAIQGNQSLKMIEEDRIRNIHNTTKAIEDQMARQQVLADALKAANDKQMDVSFESAQMGRTPLEKQFAQIQENARKAALEAGRAFSATFEGEDLSAAQAEELVAGLDQITERYKAIADAQTKNLEVSRSWEQGWKEAFDNYMDNATNAATKAGEVFGSITRNMESAIDKFVETGKFSFGDFARSIIQDLIKIELKAQATKILGAIGGEGGIFGAIGKIFGFAEGGTPPLNKPSIVGENGPELFVPRTAGTIIPNGGMAGAGAMMNAPITNNYITNNISAVDAKSVAQLFAENRKTLLGTVQMAQKELPYSNR